MGKTRVFLKNTGFFYIIKRSLSLGELIVLSIVEEKGAQDISMSGEYKAMFNDWKNRSDDFQNLLLDYEDVDDEMMPWSEIYRRAHALFKEKVWHQQPRANPLDNAIVQEENYKNAIKVLKREYNFHLEAHDDYDQKFKVWLKAYPAAKKKSILDEHEQNWSAIYTVYNKIFKDEVWNEYRDEMYQMRKEELKTNN